MRTELTKEEIERLESVGVTGVRTLYDILNVLPERVFYSYDLHIMYKGNAWRVGYYYDNERLVHVCMAELITALQMILIALAEQMNLFKTSLSKCTE